MNDNADLIQHYFYDADVGRDLVAIAEEKDLWFKVGEGDPDPNNYRCQQLKIEGRPELGEFEEKFLLIFQDVLTRYNQVVRTIANGDTGFTLIKYRTGDACSEHVDQVPHEIRVCTAIYYINDDYDGGELVFPEQGLEFKPRPGEVIVIPATDEFPHEVRPITKGNRYAVRCFYVCHVPETITPQ